jgi:hypothetical protein
MQQKQKPRRVNEYWGGAASWPLMARRGSTGVLLT